MIEKKNRGSQGFTLIELLVVIAIIGVLSSMIIVKVRDVRVVSRESHRIQQLHEMEKAIELYHADHGYYPINWDLGERAIRGECFWNDGNDFVPGIVPDYISSVPSDPTLNCEGVTHSWIYQSDGYDYKLITHGESPEEPKAAGLVDPAGDDGADPCIVDTEYSYHYGVWTPGATCWEQ